MSPIFASINLVNYRCKGADVVVAGAFGDNFGSYPGLLLISDFCEWSFCCYNCYKLLLKWIKVMIVKGFRLLQALEKVPSLLQVVTFLLQVVTKFVTEFVTEANYWFSVDCKGCNKCYKCNSKKLVSRKKTVL
jgi:hypothetical protein